MGQGLLVLRWRDKPSNSSWYIRGIREDGSFYGTVHVLDAGNGTISSVEAKLTSAEARRLFDLASLLRDSNGTQCCGDQIGVLADGPITSPKIIFRYGRGDEVTKSHEVFQEMVMLIRPRIELAVSRLNADEGLSH
jgi:hypothetical protein